MYSWSFTYTTLHPLNCISKGRMSLRRNKNSANGPCNLVAHHTHTTPLHLAFLTKFPIAGHQLIDKMNLTQNDFERICLFYFISFFLKDILF